MTTKPQQKVPTGWQLKHIGDVTEIVMGQSPSSSTYNQEGVGVPFFQGKADFTESLKTKIRYWTSSPTKLSQPGDILLSVRAPVGDIALNETEACIGRGLAAIRPKQNLTDTAFLFQILQYLKKDFNAKAQGSTFTAINGPALRIIPVLIPPLAEQKVIGKILGMVDDEIAKTEEIISATEKIKYGLMQRLFSQGIPVKLGEIANIVRGGSPRPIENFITDKKDGLNWLRIGDIEIGSKYITHTGQKIDKSGLNKTTLVKPGDFILSNSMSFGRPYIMKIEACIHDGWLAFKEIKSNLANAEFLYYLLSSQILQNKFKTVAAGSGVKNLKKESVAGIEANLPPISEQQKIADVLSSVDQKISINKQIKKRFIQLKRGLMQDLLTGAKRII